jgi:SMI1 / KNR4 family (SUKH-1)
MLTPILKELENFLVGHGYPIIKKFNDGIAEEEIIDTLTRLDLNISSKLIDLYRWKNGVAGLYEETTEEELSLFGMGIMFPFQLAVTTYIKEAIDEKYIKKNFFPLFTTGDSDYILMDLDKKKPSENLFLISPPLSISKPMTIYDSLEKLFETVLLTYKNNGYYFNGDSLEIDYELETEIATELNPNSKFWKE